MRRLLLSATALALAVAFSAVPATAQSNSGKFYLGLGIAYGNYDLSGLTIPSEYKNNVSYFGEAGLRFAPSLALGVEADYYTKSSSGASISVWYYNAALAFYPDAAHFWIKVLAGYASTSQNQGGGSQGGYDMGLGLGYDWHLIGSFTVVPFAQYVAQLSSAKFPGGTNNVKSQLFQVGAAIALNH